MLAALVAAGCAPAASSPTPTTVAVAQPPASATPMAPPSRDDPCLVLSQHLFDLALADADAAGRASLEANREARIEGFREACAGDPETWSAKLRTCMLDGTTLAEAKACQGGPPAYCDRGQFGPVTLDDDLAAGRRGLATTHFSELPTTKEKPVEVCGLAGELRWLTKVSCDDDREPFASAEEAHGSRVGSVGVGGRCGTVIDLYEVPCPEGTYEVFIDMYMCGPGERWR